jgi:hypothetical protein
MVKKFRPGRRGNNHMHHTARASSTKLDRRRVMVSDERKTPFLALGAKNGAEEENEHN